MLIYGKFFKTQSDQKYTPKRTNLHHIIKNFLAELHTPLNPPSIHMRATIIDMYFYMKIAIFCSILFQDTHQNAPIIQCFQNFLHESKLYIFHIKNGIFKKIVYKK